MGLTTNLKLLGAFLLVSTVIGTVRFVQQLNFYEESIFTDPAVFQVPETSIDIILERRNIHPFLAEYERTLVLRIDGKDVLRKEVAVDTGGYSRMNVFRLSADEYFLQGKLSADSFYLDVSRTSLIQLNEKPLAAGRFIGSFDHDESGWRFIPVSERQMLQGGI
ncbi:MAG: hypothetical protein DMF63_09300 [Acidobacteria bacterium]|nr:MAG: hypothetical protein DMF63_09300 [Acidobacteriota bacterium]